MSRFKRSLSLPPPELGELEGGALELPAVLPPPNVPELLELPPLLKVEAPEELPPVLVT